MNTLSITIPYPGAKKQIKTQIHISKNLKQKSHVHLKSIYESPHSGECSSGVFFFPIIILNTSFYLTQSQICPCSTAGGKGEWEELF